MAHTPGPWATEFKRHAELEEGSHVHLLTDGKDLVIGLLSSWIADPETKLEAEANARLIAAAPSLLEALEEAEAVFRTLAVDGPSSTALELADKYAAVLRSATGAA